VSKNGSAGIGTVFEESDRTRYTLDALGTFEEAERRAAGAGTLLFAVRPAWSYPAKEWIAADPALWLGHPASE
jgi:hypothetical protein